MSSASESDSSSSDSSSSSEGKGVALTPSKAVNKSVPLKKPRETLPLPLPGIAAEDESAEDDSDSQMVADASKQKKKKGARKFDGDDSKTPKPKKMKSGEQVGVGAIKRVWSEEDEIVLLKGILEFKEKNNVWDVDVFFNFIKKSLQLEVNKKQVTEKIRKTKIKYDNSVVKKRVFTSGHEKRLFDLSEKIWGKEAGAATDVDPPTTKSNMKPRTASKATASNSKDAKNGNGNAEGVKEGEANDSEKADKQASGNGKPNKEGGSWQFIEKESIAMGLDEKIVKAGLSFCRDERKTELDNKWKQVYVEESDLCLRKLDLAREGIRLINETLKDM